MSKKLLLIFFLIWIFFCCGISFAEQQTFDDNYKIYNSLENLEALSAWGGDISLSGDQDPLFQGGKVLKFVAQEKWAGCIIPSAGHLGGENLNPQGKFNQLRFWIYALPENQKNNTLNIHFYDRLLHNTDQTKNEYWTKETAVYGKWTLISVPFSRLDKTLALTNISKIQLQQFHPGIYYYAGMILTNGPYIIPEGVYQRFETPDITGYALNQEDSFRLSVKGEPVNEGDHAGRFEVKKTGTWKGCVLLNEGNQKDINIGPDVAYSGLAFWVYAIPSASGNAKIKIVFYDNSLHHDESTGAEFIVNVKIPEKKWIKILVPFQKLDQTLDIHHITQIRFYVSEPGIYYLDNIFSQSAEYVVYHSFERLSNIWGWVSGEKLAVTNEIVHDGVKALKVNIPLYKTGKKVNYMGGCGIQPENLSWNSSLDSEINDRLEFWIKANHMNGFDNNLGVEFFDTGLYFKTPAAVWTGKNAVYGEWTKMTIKYSSLPGDLDLNSINKIQLVFYWPGIYYIDNIISTSTKTPEWKRFELGDTTLQWESVPGVQQYILEESLPDHPGQWKIVYKGPDTSYAIPRLTKAFYRLSSSSGAKQSEPGEIMDYCPPATILDWGQLMKQGVLVWKNFSNADSYEIQKKTDKQSDWQAVYTGPWIAKPAAGSENTWYRIRAVNSKTKETGPWSAPVIHATKPSFSGFLKTDGRMIRDCYGKGNQVILRGVNIGSWLLLEIWMSALGGNPPLIDDWQVRDLLQKRFGDKKCHQLLDAYQKAWIKSGDLDIIKNLGMNMIRLPVYYRDLMDDKGNVLADSDSFSKIDWIVNASASRGLYVIIDLHGAPGNQNKEHHSGRSDFNKLFLNNKIGEEYKLQTLKLWTALAQRYKDNPAVAGYDLLNEPSGLLKTYDKDELQDLYSLYDRIYKAIRSVDPDHIIFMEAAWHWSDMPHPSVFGWENVSYSFHYYGPGGDDAVNFQAQKKYFDTMVRQNEEFSDFNVPIFVGEFSPQALKQSWEYVLPLIKKAEWNWSFWAYKAMAQSSTWGLYNGNNGTDFRNKELPDLYHDSFEVLKEKMSHYDTIYDFHPYSCLKDMIEKSLK